MWDGKIIFRNANSSPCLRFCRFAHLLWLRGSSRSKPVAAYTGVDANAAWENLWADRFSLAEVGFKDILESHPADGGATRGLALVHFAKGADEESATLLAKGLAAEPTSPFADAVQAFAIEVMPDGKKSIETLRKLAETESLGKMPWDTQRAGRKFLLDYYKFYEPNAAKITSLAESLKAVRRGRSLDLFPIPRPRAFLWTMSERPQWNSGEGATFRRPMDAVCIGLLLTSCLPMRLYGPKRIWGANDGGRSITR